jgi:hypothetical protein
MSLVGSLAGHTPRSSASFPIFRGAAAYRLGVYVACTVLALAISYTLGKEMAWDVLNHHLYAGFSAIHDRFRQDYFAAGPQAYLNPYAYVPFYALVAAGLPALAVASVLAVLQSAMLWLTYELGLVVSPAGRPGSRAAFAICGVAMALLNPILLQQLGTSFNDITTGELVLGGWIVLATTVRAPSAPRVIAAAVLLGVATALKLTNAVHAVSAATMLLFLPLPLNRRLRFASVYGLALGVSFTAVAAPWAYRLATVFGNPFFPLLNGLFRSPEFTTGRVQHLRFVPSSLTEALWRPFAMLDPWTMIHEELRAPDSRYALLLVLALILAGVVLSRPLWRPRVQGAGSPPKAASPPADPRVLAALGTAFAVNWVLWLAGSGNSRYFLPLACVAGVLVIGIVFNLFSTRPKVRNYVLAAIFATQAVQVWWGAELRWDASAWGGKWFEVTVPDALAKQPALYLTMEVRSNSFLAPYLAPEAGLVDIASSYPLEGTGANGRRVEALVQRYAPHVRMLLTGDRLHADSERRAPTVSGVDGTLQRFGLRTDPADCAKIAVKDLASGPVYVSAPKASPAASTAPEPLYLVSCALVPDHADHADDLARERTANLVLDRLEDACPELFQPRRPPTGRYGNMWRRIYLNTDLVAWVSRGQVKFFDPAHGDDIVYLGPESEWARAAPPLACGRRHGHYFARVLNPRRDSKDLAARTAALPAVP